ncbi:hypothetical protein ZIOFF_070553 [Zingiber officinale]|uniref:Protein kinase domain-containing protein n=1 Tax=Zingiber officinale TaxID=94328 RepID=A0A8J5EPY9_ZINOF|nr:hypothetical protein ZIOFF_070553 [Zingiber officinale]
MEFIGKLLLHIILLISLEGATSWLMEHENFTLPSNCSKTCGDIQIEYPFGIGINCSYAVGFNLTCSQDQDHPRLLLGDGNIQVRAFDMNEGLVIIESPYATLDVDAQSNHTALINLKDLPLSYNLLSTDFGSSFGYNILHVAGCSVTAIIVDLDTNTAIDSCNTICSTTINTPTTHQIYMSRNGYCSIDLYSVRFSNLSLAIQLNRLDEKMDHIIINSTSSIIATIYDDELTDYDDFQRFIDDRNRTGMMASLAWYFNDYSTCKEAMERTNTYACLSDRSECYDVVLYEETSGYNCRCSSDYVGNPYLHDGCKLDKNFTFTPAKDCQPKCGNVTISFPFGLKQGCYRDEDFALTCNETSSPPTLLFRDYVVSNISVKEGQLEYTIDFYSDNRNSHFTSSKAQKDQTIMDWVIDNQSCKDAAKDNTIFACIYENSSCLDVKNEGYRCICKHGTQWYVYFDVLTKFFGILDINECNSSSKVCTGNCINTNGSFYCICPQGTSGDPVQGVCLPNKRNSLLFGTSLSLSLSLVLSVILGASIGTSLLLLCIALVIVGKKWKQRNQQKIKKRNFLRNHGLLLQQLISTSDHVEERTNIFSLEEIEKATNNFDETRVLGRGGHGTVYKGILSDQRVVAIKKSKIVKTSEIDQFINEIAILSQMNHRNVVKLLGCCLETEVPLLIYEFISNGTLSDHLHVSQDESKLSWDDRLRIASESAGALAYLHSAASMSVFHRDVKSSNILLDDTFKAKVSDFGASRFIPLDQTHIVTAIHGTFGYIDPEYYQTSQLTEKSDVYSFGIILLELLTGKKPIFSTKDGLQQNLAMNFLQATRENTLLDLIEDRVLQEGTKQEFLEISSLIEICLNLKGAKRPTMKEVEYKLQSMRKVRMKKKGVCILEGNEDVECLLSMTSHSSSQLVDEISQGNTRNYSFEKELMWSQNCAR